MPYGEVSATSGTSTVYSGLAFMVVTVGGASYRAFSNSRILFGEVGMLVDAVPSFDGDEVDIHVDHRGSICVVSVRGEIDLVSIGSLEQALGDELESRPGGLVADLSGVGFFGSSGLSALVAAENRAKELGVPFAVVAVRRAVVRPLAVTGLDELLNVCETVEDAVRAFATRG